MRRPSSSASAHVGLTALACATALFILPTARAYEPGRTHAGLTERAVEASRLHNVLARLGRPLGLLEPLRIGLDLFD